MVFNPLCSTLKAAFFAVGTEETGKTALENIHIHQIERAKNMLLGTNDSVATITYALRFDYP